VQSPPGHWEARTVRPHPRDQPGPSSASPPAPADPSGTCSPTMSRRRAPRRSRLAIDPPAWVRSAPSTRRRQATLHRGRLPMRGGPAGDAGSSPGVDLALRQCATGARPSPRGVARRRRSPLAASGRLARHGVRVCNRRTTSVSSRRGPLREPARPVRTRDTSDVAGAVVQTCWAAGAASSAARGLQDLGRGRARRSPREKSPRRPSGLQPPCACRGSTRTIQKRRRDC